MSDLGYIHKRNRTRLAFNESRFLVVSMYAVVISKILTREL